MKAVLFVLGCMCLLQLHGGNPIPSFTMRIDDNHSVDDWCRVAEIFERRGMRCSFAVVPSALSEAQGACLKELAARGHLIMDHTPNHTFYQATYYDRAAFDHARRKPFVAEADEAKMKLYFRCEADKTHPKNRRIQAHISKNVVTFDSRQGIRGMYDFIKLPDDETIYGLQKNKKTGALELRDFWRRPLARIIDLADVEVIHFDQSALQPCDDVLRELAMVSRERFDHFGLPRPEVWVRPGGWDPAVAWERIARVYGDEFGYVGADAMVDGPRGLTRWTSGCDKMGFFDWGGEASPERFVKEIQDNLAAGRYYVMLSHMCHKSLVNQSEKWFEKTECFAQLLVDRKVPTMTMKESLEARFGCLGCRR